MLQITKIISSLTKNIPKYTNKLTKRTFLSQAYYCNEVWEQRLHSPVLSKVNLDELYHELDQRFTKSGIISAVDVDIYVNKVKDELYIEELLDLAHKLRLSAETSNALHSTEHAIIRYLSDINHNKELLNVLDDRLNYGVFLDYYTANILMDKFYKAKDFVNGARIASQLMLQEECEHPLSVNLGLIHCYNFLSNPQGWPEPEVPEEPEDEVKIRVKYLRNPYNDEHFDLKDPFKIVGKTLIEFTRTRKTDLEKSLHAVGLCLFGDEKNLLEAIKDMKIIYADALKLIPEGNELKKHLGNFNVEEMDVKKLIGEQVKAAERKTSEEDIANQCKLYAKWEAERKEALEKQLKRVEIAKRLENVESLQEDLKLREQKLWFFEKEESIELKIEELAQEKVKDEKTESKQEDDNYVPPNVSKYYN